MTDNERRIDVMPDEPGTAETMHDDDLTDDEVISDSIWGTTMVSGSEPEPPRPRSYDDLVSGFKSRIKEGTRGRAGLPPRAEDGEASPAP